MPRLMRGAFRLGRGLLLGLLALLAFGLGLRAWDAQRGAPLRPWHEVVPPELDAAALGAADWGAFLAAEARAFEVVRREVSLRLAPEDRGPANRYDPASPMHAPGFATDWNRSFVLAPAGEPRGAAVLVHGLTDAPFSMRHLARIYAAAGFLAVVPRMPGHGTVPAGLAEATWQDWAAAARLAVREAQRRVPDAPLHLVGYSNGGALALLLAAEAVLEPGPGAPDRLVLLSPMLGVTPFARFAGIAGWPALLPAFAGAAWLSVQPEFNPFKFNSFPVNAARESHRLTVEVQARLRRLAASGRLARLPPVLTFQSAIDATVSTAAVISGLYALLPDNGSELVLFDLNREARLGPLLDPAADAAVARLPATPRRFRLTLVTNAAADTPAVEERSTAAGSREEARRPLHLAWPQGMFSLSHVALPFPPEDGLYGSVPAAEDAFGVRLGTLAPRGERGVLVTDLDSLLRASSNPFFPYLRERIAGILGEAAGTPGPGPGRAAGLAPPRER